VENVSYRLEDLKSGHVKVRDRFLWFLGGMLILRFA